RCSPPGQRIRSPPGLSRQLTLCEAILARPLAVTSSRRKPCGCEKSCRASSPVLGFDPLRASGIAHRIIHFEQPLSEDDDFQAGDWPEASPVACGDAEPCRDRRGSDQKIVWRYGGAALRKSRPKRRMQPGRHQVERENR